MTGNSETPPPFFYTAQQIENALSGVVLGLYGDRDISLSIVKEIGNDIHGASYENLENYGRHNAHAEGLVECLWVVVRHRNLFGEDAKISLPHKLHEYFDSPTHGQRPDIRPLADDLKSAYDSEVTAMQEQDQTARRKNRNEQQNAQRNNLRRFLKKVPKR